jgi:hypothetical protein
MATTALERLLFAHRLLGRMPLKAKIEVVLNQKGQLKCPNGGGAKADATAQKPASAPDMLALIIANLTQRRAGKPKTVKTLAGTIRSLSKSAITDAEVAALLSALQAKGVVTISGTKIAYAEKAS